MKPIEDGKLHVLSPSLLNTFDDSSAFGCQRRGWFKYVKGLPEPTTDAMTKGTHLHAMNEEYLKTGKLLLGTPEQTAWFNAGRHYLEGLVSDLVNDPTRTVTMLTEHPLPSDFTVYGVKVSDRSRCDVVIRGASPAIIDWKTTSDIEKYGKTPGQLAKDTQMLIYAMAFHPTAERVVLTHGQYQTKGRVRFHASEVELTRKELDDNYERVIFPLVETVRSVAAEKEVKNVKAVSDDRSDSRCRRCPHNAVCPTTQSSLSESLAMSIFNRIRQQNAAPAPQPETPAAPVAVLPPDAPKSDPAKAAEPVEGFSPVPPPRRNLIVNAPTSEPSPSADLAAEAPKPTPAPAPEPEKKRGPGRPPGAKNKPKEAPADATAAQFEAEVESRARGERAAAALNIQVPSKGDRVDALAEMLDRDIRFESVTVTYGLTINIGDYNSVRVDCSMTSRFSGDADAAYKATLAKVVGYVEAEAQKVQSAIAEKQSVKK